MTDFDDPLIGNDPTVGNGDHIERPARSTSPLEGGLMDLVTYYGSFVPTLRPEQTMRLPTIDDATALAREVLELREASAALIGKLDAVEPVLTSMFAERQLVRGRGVYDGPTYGEELEALRALLVAPPALGGDNGD